MNQSSDSELRLYGRDAQLRWALTVESQETTQLAVDADGVIWQGIVDLFPADSGFAPVQWISVATLDGTRVASSQRSESRPLPDGRSVGITETSASLIGPDGRGTRWELPASLTVVAAESFLDGIIVAAVDDPIGELGRMLVVYLRPNADPTGFWLERHWGTIIPGPTTVAVTNQAIFGLASGEEGMVLSLRPLDSLYPTAPFSLSGVDWIAGDYRDVRNNSGDSLVRDRFASAGRSLAWDGDSGILFLTDQGLSWLTTEGEMSITSPIDEIGSLVEVARIEDRFVVGATALDDFNTVIWFDLETGTITEAPAIARTLDRETFTAGGRTATIEQPDWSGIERGEIGEPLPPYDLPQLVVRGEEGSELLRLTVGTMDRPFVQIHDFDGRRLIIGAGPFEPALPPETVWIIDLECTECTETFDTAGLTWFELIGALDSAGPVVSPAMPGAADQTWPFSR